MHSTDSPIWIQLASLLSGSAFIRSGMKSVATGEQLLLVSPDRDPILLVVVIIADAIDDGHASRFRDSRPPRVTSGSDEMRL